MTKYRISTIARLLGVSTDTVRRWIEDKYIEVVPSEEPGPTRVTGKSVVEFIQSKADYHQLETRRSGEASIRNHLEGLVIKIVKDRVMSQVELQCGPYRVVSLISTEALEELGIEVGSVAAAQIKATNVSINVPKGDKL